MNKNRESKCIGTPLHRYVVLAGLVALTVGMEAGQVILDPGGPKDLPRRYMRLRYAGVEPWMRVVFGTPGILQTTSDPASGVWESVTTNSPMWLEPWESGDNRFFRVLSAERPVIIRTPSSYDPEVPLPLVIALHGYSGSPLEGILSLGEVAEARGVLLCYPGGTWAGDGVRFWDATDACCNFTSTEINDSGYLRDLIDDAMTQLNADPKRIYVIGYSNGGFMAHRMACDHADVIAAIVSIAGATFKDPAACQPSDPVNILHIHGSADTRNAYKGGEFYADGPLYPGAQETIDQWASFNGCEGKVVETELTLNLFEDDALDTSVTYFEHNAPGGSVELWTVHEGEHDMPDSPEFAALILDWLLAHPKP